MTSNIENAMHESRKRHHRDVWLKIVLPVIGGLLVLVLLTALVSVMRSAGQLAVSRNVIVTLFILCPMAICMLPFSVGLMTLAVMSGRLHPLSKRPLRRGEALSLKVRERVEAIADRAARWSIAFSARVAPITNWTDKLLSSEPKRLTHEGNHDDKSAKHH
jgi:hypothetical protein